MVAIEANNINEAYNSLKEKGFRLSKNQIKPSSVTIDYVFCEKIR